MRSTFTAHPPVDLLPAAASIDVLATAAGLRRSQYARRTEQLRAPVPVISLLRAVPPAAVPGALSAKVREWQAVERRAALLQRVLAWRYRARRQRKTAAAIRLQREWRAQRDVRAARHSSAMRTALAVRIPPLSLDKVPSAANRETAAPRQPPKGREEQQAASSREMFARFDTDGDGVVTRDDFLRAMERVQPPRSPAALHAMFDAVRCRARTRSPALPRARLAPDQRSACPRR